MAIAFISIGSNLGDKLVNCQMAIDRLKEAGIEVLKRSSFYETEPHGSKNQSLFVNCAVKVKTSLTPPNLLTILQNIEDAFGRKRDKKWDVRTIDLDILFYDNVVIEGKNLSIPHPLSHQRGFVLIPLKEIEPELIHPLLKKTITELAGGLRDGKKVIPIVSIR